MDSGGNGTKWYFRRSNFALNEKEDARPVIEDFEGAVLFKGSRKSGLETLVPSWAI